MFHVLRIVQYTRSVTGRLTGDRLSLSNMLAIERRPTNLYDCLCAIILEHGILLHFFHPFICVVCGPSRAVIPFHGLATRYGSGVVFQPENFT